jgi:hypothetical protein
VLRAALLVLLVVATCACGKRSSTGASPSPTGAGALGCDFTIPNARPNGLFTQASIDAAVAAAPAAIRADLRIVYDATRTYAADLKVAQAAPAAERPRLVRAASRDIDNPTYQAASRHLRAYFMQHCTRLGPSPSK